MCHVQMAHIESVAPKAKPSSTCAPRSGRVPLVLGGTRRGAVALAVCGARAASLTSEL